MPDRPLSGSTDRFRVFPQFDTPELKAYANSRQRLPGLLLDCFPGDRPQDRLARALIERRAVNLKELLESFEFHHRVRRRLRGPVMADLFCGHGLTGVLFAAAERSVERVLLLDHRRPDSFDSILEAAASTAPWVLDKVEYREHPIDIDTVTVPAEAALLAVHACGHRTDTAIQIASRGGHPLAAMPCCYRTSRPLGPSGLRETLGRPLAVDIDRTYRLEAAGLHVDWEHLPDAITPMNRILVAWHPH